MRRFIFNLSIFPVITLILAVIWPNAAVFGASPVLTPLGQLRTGLSVPMRLALDAEGNLYVADARKKAVLRFDPFGEQTGAFAAVPISGGGLAVTADGRRVYAACGNAVAILNGADGELLGYLGSGAGEFGAAGFIALDGVGFIFVADTQGRVVKVYNPQGEFVYSIENPLSPTGRFPSIFSLAVNPVSGEVYVADSLRDPSSAPKIEVFDLSGQLLRTHASDSAFGPILPIFGGMTFDDSGRGYFLDAGCSEVRVLDLPATFLLRHQNTTGSFGRWVDAAYASRSKRLYIANEGGLIEIFGIDGGTTPTPPPAIFNVKPDLPLPLSPLDGSEVTVSRPVLTFQNAVDPDGDPLSYAIRLHQDAELIATYERQVEGNATTAVEVDRELAENVRYVWSVQAFDGTEASGWSAGHSFYVNAVQQPPAVPVLLAPGDGAVLDGPGELSWLASTDPDPFDNVHYVVEISTDQTFAPPALEQSVTAASVALTELTDHPELTAGRRHYWRVRAVDHHDLASEPSSIASFRYAPTTLSVNADWPAARVYLHGNHGYAGRNVGATPLELRDVAPGVYSVVVEHPGFEPYVAQVRLEAGNSVRVAAELVPALASAKLMVIPLTAGRARIHLAGEASPFLVDFDNDGLIDLLAGDASGVLTLFRGVSARKEMVAFAAGISLDLPLIYGANPFVVDWNNDGRKDLLVGAGDGTIRLFLNRGTEVSPVYDEGAYLPAGSGPIAVGGAASPAVVDFDGDGAKDLVVGTAAGEVLLFRNSGSDAVPQLASGTLLLSSTGPVAPFFSDWDADGRKDLLLGTAAGVYLYRRQAEGTFASAVQLTDGQVLSWENRKRRESARSAPEGLHPFVLDLDGQKGKDLIVGNAAGEMYLLLSKGAVPVAAFWDALEAQVAQLDQRIAVRTPQLERLMAKLTAALRARNLNEALSLVAVLEVWTERESKTSAPSAPTDQADAVAKTDPSDKRKKSKTSAR